MLFWWCNKRNCWKQVATDAKLTPKLSIKMRLSRPRADLKRASEKPWNHAVSRCISKNVRKSVRKKEKQKDLKLLRNPSCGARNCLAAWSAAQFRPLRQRLLPLSATGGGRKRCPARSACLGFKPFTLTKNKNGHLTASVSIFGRGQKDLTENALHFLSARRPKFSRISVPASRSSLKTVRRTVF